MVLITIVTGANLNQLITGGPHIVAKKQISAKNNTAQRWTCFEDIVEYLVYMAEDHLGSNRSLLGCLDEDHVAFPGEDWPRIWVCRYIPNYSHLIGIMIINHWVYGYTIFRHTHLPMVSGKFDHSIKDDRGNWQQWKLGNWHSQMQPMVLGLIYRTITGWFM